MTLQRLRPVVMAGEEDRGHVPGHHREIRTGRRDPRGIGLNPQVTAALVSFDFATPREAAAGSAANDGRAEDLTDSAIRLCTQCRIGPWPRDWLRSRAAA